MASASTYRKIVYHDRWESASDLSVFIKKSKRMPFHKFLDRKPAKRTLSSGPVKFGVLTFSYQNAKNFSKSVSENGFFSLNLGDYMQTLAARRLLNEVGVPNNDIIDIDRDSLSSYSGEPVILLMSAVFFPWSFPIPDTVIPVFLGFHASEAVIKGNLGYFRQHAPIGCRDQDTTDLFRKHGVEAYTTGCVTMTFEPRPEMPKEGKTLFVCGSGAGAFPAIVTAGMPAHLLRTTEFIFQRKIVHSHPLTAGQMKDAERYAGFLLDYYRSQATLIVTPLHHAATPCISSGIPVVICRNMENTRFSFLSSFMDINTPDTFDAIDWNDVSLPDISEIRNRFIENAATKLMDAAASLRS